MMNHKILIVDDEPANLRLLERLFRRQYQVIIADSGIEALELLKQHNVALIISDQLMPGMTGIEFLKRASEMSQHTVRIILTGYTDVEALVEVINSGVVYKYVSKPWVNEDLQQTVVRALQHYEMNKPQYELLLNNERLSERIKATQRGFMRLLADMLYRKNESAFEHARRTGGYAIAIGHRLNLERAEGEQLLLTAFIHEVAQLSVSDVISHKAAAAMTKEESQIINHSNERTAEILANIPDMSEIALAVRYYQEHYDGGGYAKGLSGEQFPLFASIVAVADEYDLLTSQPPNYLVLTHDEAVEQLKADSGKRFDPTVIEAFCELEAIGKIRRAIAEGLVGSRLFPSRIFYDTKNIPMSELLQKFKAQPVLAMDILKLANVAVNGEATSRLLPAMKKLGEARMRRMVEENGLPASHPKTEYWSTRALRRAVAAQLLASHTGIIYPDDAYTLGLLYEVGELLLANLFPEEMLALEKSSENVRLRRQVEMFGVDFAQVSRWMLEACGVPGNLSRTLKTHDDFLSVDAPGAFLIRIAHAIAQTEDTGIGVNFDAEMMDAAKTLNLSRADLNKIYERTNAISEQYIEVQEAAVY